MCGGLCKQTFFSRTFCEVMYLDRVGVETLRQGSLSRYMSAKVVYWDVLGHKTDTHVI